VGDALPADSLVVDLVIAFVEEFHDLVGRNHDEWGTAELRQDEDFLVLGVLWERNSALIICDIVCRMTEKAMRSNWDLA
jgi:hypothetical protein